MVAQITEGTAFDKHGRPFRRRKYLPGILLLVALTVVTMTVWVVALNRPPDVREAAVCNAPPAPTDPNAPAPSLGEQVTRSEMIDVIPAKLADTKIRVLNASGQGGQAAEVAGALRDQGFAEPTAANDTVYANARLECQGQIRFGPAGRAAAAAVWIFVSSVGSAACVASGRRLASTASMSSLWVNSLNSVPMARSTVASLR